MCYHARLSALTFRLLFLHGYLLSIAMCFPSLLLYLLIRHVLAIKCLAYEIEVRFYFHFQSTSSWFENRLMLFLSRNQKVFPLMKNESAWSLVFLCWRMLSCPSFFS